MSVYRHANNSLVIEGIRSLIVLMTIFCTSSRFIVMLCIMLHSHLRCFGLSTYLASINYSHRRYLCLILSFRPSIFTSLIAQVMVTIRLVFSLSVVSYRMLIGNRITKETIFFTMMISFIDCILPS